MKKLIVLFALLVFTVIESQAQFTFTSAESKEFVEAFQETNLIERIDMNRLRVYVNDSAWNFQLDAEKKEMLVCLVADYFKYHHPKWDSNTRPGAELYNNRTAQRVARWSNWSGVNID